MSKTRSNIEVGDEQSLESRLESTSRQTDELTFALFIKIIWRNRILISKVVAISAVLSVIFSFTVPVWYTATTKILPPQQNQSLATALMGQLGPLGQLSGAAQGLGLTNANAVYVSMLQSRTVQDAIINRFDLKNVYGRKRMSDARKSLDSHSNISLGTKDNVITISVEDKDPKRSAALANAYVEELRGRMKSLALTEAGQRRMFFEEQLELAKNNLADAEQALAVTQQKTGVIQLDSQARAIIETVVRLKAAIAVKEVELRAMRSFATDQNAQYVRTEQELEGMRSQLGSLEKRTGGSGDVQIGTGNVPQAGLEYLRKLREVRYQETIFELLAKQFEAAKLDESRSAGVLQVLDVAVEPDRKSFPKRSVIVIIGTILGFIGIVVYILRARVIAMLGLSESFASSRYSGSHATDNSIGSN